MKWKLTSKKLTIHPTMPIKNQISIYFTWFAASGGKASASFSSFTSSWAVFTLVSSGTFTAEFHLFSFW